MFQKKYKNTIFFKTLLEYIDNSHNYVKIRVLKDYVALVYWVREPTKMTKTLFLYYNDYDLDSLKQSQAVELRNQIYEEMILRSYHKIANEKTGEFGKKNTPCIYPR